jgi:hypothetical protein
MERQNRKAQAHNKCLTSELIPPLLLLLLLLRLYVMLPSFFVCLVFVVALFHCFFFISLVDSLYTTLGFWVSSCCLAVLYFSTDPAFFSSLVGSCSCAEVARAYEQTKP